MQGYKAGMFLGGSLVGGGGVLGWMRLSGFDGGSGSCH